MRRFSMRIGRYAAGAGVFLAPVLFPACLFLFLPVGFQKFYNAYTGLTHQNILDWLAGGESSPPWFSEMCFDMRLYLSRIAIEFFIRSYHHVAKGLLASAVLLTAAFSLPNLARRARRFGKWALVLDAGAFFLIALAVASALGFMKPVLLAAALACLYAVNFPLAARLSQWGAAAWQKAATLLASIAFPLVLALAAPAFVLMHVARCFAPASNAAARTAAFIGRIATTLCVFPVVVLAFHPNREPPLSPGVRLVIAGDDPYDIEIDRRGRRVLVTRSVRTGTPLLVFDWDLSSPAQSFRIDTPECEDIALDAERRLIYHVVRETGTTLAYDADTLDLKSRWDVSPDFRSCGTTKLALDARRRLLFVSSERDFLYRVDVDPASSQTTVRVLADVGEACIAADEESGRLYAHLRELNRLVAFDSETCAPLAEARAPAMAQRMAFAREQKRLYVPDARNGAVWVYSTPDISLLKRIPASRGLRALAVDEEHNLLLTGNYLTGHVDAIDLASDKRVGRLYVGPNCRLLEVDPERRMGFISLTKKGFMAFEY